MRLALYGKKLQADYVNAFQQFLTKLNELNINWSVYGPFWEQVREHLNLSTHPPFFSDNADLKASEPDFLISFGGDGTLLDAVALIKDAGIPVLGINAGRLGFLSSTGMEKLAEVPDALQNNYYSIEERSLLEFSNGQDIFRDNHFALNDFTIHKRDTSSMLTIHTYLNEELINTYWSDGLIVATPTGSTAYSLSCGGPVIFPDTKSLVITPVASHNLAIRPVIVPEDTQISFSVEGRGKNFLISLDSRHGVIDYGGHLTVKKAPFSLKIVKLRDQSFIFTLREKLMLGVDNRNT